MRRIVTQGRRSNPSTFVAGPDEVTVHQGVIYVHDGATPGGNPLETGGELAPTDAFTDALEEMVGLEELIAYWKFDETATSTNQTLTQNVEIIDYGPNALNFTINSGTQVEMGGVSAIADNRTGMILHGGTQINLPLTGDMWPSGPKNEMCYGFGLHFSHRWDFLELCLRDTENSIDIMKFSFVNGDRVEAYLSNENGEELLEIQSPNDTLYSGKMLVALERNFDTYRIRVNEQVYSLNIVLNGNGTFPPVPSSLTGYEFYIRGGIDSPVVSHFVISPEDFGDTRWAQLMSAAGIRPLFEPDRQQPVGIAIDSEWVSAVFDLTNIRHLWRFNEKYGHRVGDVWNNTPLVIAGETFIGWEEEPIINDGTYAARLIGGMVSTLADSTVWEQQSFTMGAAVFNSEGGNFEFNLIGTDVLGTSYTKATLVVGETSIVGALKNEDGNNFATVSFDSNWITGRCRYLVIFEYDSVNELLKLWVNGYSVTADASTGTGTPRLTIPVPLNTLLPTYSISGSACNIHMAFHTNDNQDDITKVTNLFSKAGFQQGLFRPRGLTGNYQIAPGVTVDLVDGVIVSWND